ncbi:hypothetical protein [Runella sp.]|uniref:hypothetical protein n=1 Tax=Runella sp. TaxID=1960881 RepID=UPI003D0998E2
MKIWADEKEYTLADDWSAVPSDRVMGLLRIAHEQPANERSKLDALQLINPIPPKIFRKLVSWQVNELAQTLEWVWEKKLEGRPFESFEHGGIIYHTPPPKLRATNFAEYLTGVVYLFQAYYDTDTPREVSGAHLVASLCRPMQSGTDPLSPNWSGDYREPFNEYVVEARAKLFLDLPVGILVAIVQYFVEELKWLYDHYDVFDDPTPAAKAKAKEEEFDWQARLMDMKNLRYVVAEERIFGTVAEVMKAPVNDVFDALERLKNKESGGRPVTPTTPTPEPDETD